MVLSALGQCVDICNDAHVTVPRLFSWYIKLALRDKIEKKRSSVQEFGALKMKSGES